MKHPPLTGELATIDAADENQIVLVGTPLPLYGVILRSFPEAEADPATDWNDGDECPVFVLKDQDNYLNAVATWDATGSRLALVRGASKGTIGVGDTVSVSCERQQRLALDASETISGEFADPRISRTSVHQWLGTPKEPVGFVNRGDVGYSWDNPSRTLSVFPTATQFTYFADSVRQTVTETLQIQIPDVTGLNYIYLDSAGGIYRETSRKEVENQDCPVCVIYWDTAEYMVIPDIIDDSHECSMSDATRDRFASTVGPIYESGLGVSAISEGSGNVDSSAQFSMSSGFFWLEDIRALVAENALLDEIPIVWKEGAAGDWKMALSSFLGVTAGSGRLAYNEWTGATWQLTECGNNNYALAHLFVFPGANYQSVIVVGQSQYGTVGDARTGAETEIALIDAEGMPGGKALDVATFILQTHNSYSNQIKARIRATGDGEDYLDWRFSTPVGGGAASDHNALAGLQGGTPSERHHITAAQEILLGLFLDPIFDKADPGDIGLNTPDRGAFSKVSIGHTADGDLLDVRGNVPIVNIQEAAAATDRFRFAVEGGARHITGEGAEGVNIRINPYPQDNTSHGHVDLFRVTNTTGARKLRLYRGTNQNIIESQFSVDGAPSFIKVGNLGLGIEAPQARMHVVGNPGEFGILVDNTETGDGVKVKTADSITNNGYLWQQGAFNILNIYSGTDNACRLRLANAATTTVQLNANGNSYFNGGNVGIGIETPAQKLHINDGTSAFIVSNTGRVGIGTTSPAYQLDVNNAQLRLQGNSPNLYFQPPSGAANRSWTIGANISDTVLGSLSIFQNNVGYPSNPTKAFELHPNITAAFGGETPNANYGITTNKGILINNSVSNPIIHLDSGVADQTMTIAHSAAGDYSYIQAGTWTEAPKELRLNPGGGNVRIANLLINTSTTVSGFRVVLNASMAPLNGGARDLGSATHDWRDIYLVNQPTITSDERKKTEIQNLDPLANKSLLMGLRPVSFKHKPPQINEKEPEPKPDPQPKMRTAARWNNGKVVLFQEQETDENGDPVFEVPPDPPDDEDIFTEDTSTHFGFIAQEVGALLDSLEIPRKDFAPLAYDAESDVYGFRYAEMVALIVEFMQQQENTIQAQEERIAALETAVEKHGRKKNAANH